jgi:hypothetical protein
LAEEWLEMFLVQKQQELLVATPQPSDSLKGDD